MITKEVEGVINVLAEKFGSTGRHLWDVLVRQKYISGIMMVSVCLIFAVISGLAVRWAWRNHNKEEHKYDEGPIAAGFIGVVIFIICIIVGIFGFMQIVNPEYYALMTVIN